MLEVMRSLPSETGIPEACIIRMMERLERKQIPMHSLLLYHKDRLICESYYAPCEAGTLHRMFSITKSLTGVAIGLLAEEGKLALDDKIIDYFPEKVPANVHPYIADMTIRNMLMMRTCHEKTTYKFNMVQDWVESFFTTRPTHPPGTVFHYDTSSAHVLCALAEKLSGMDMLSYLKKKLAPIGLSQESYLLKDPFGVSLGGTGLVATSMDLLRFALFLYYQGNIDGKQLLSASYIKEATSCLTATAVTAPIPGEGCGYGMQIWQAQQNGYVCYGMGGQLIIVLPDYELICVTTADTQGMGGGNQQIYDALYEEVLPYIEPSKASHADGTVSHSENSLESNPKGAPDERYRQFLASRSLYVPKGAALCPLVKQIDGKCFQIQGRSDFSFFQLHFQDPDGSQGTDGEMVFGYHGREYRLAFGMGYAKAGELPLYALHCATSGVWLPDDTLYVRVNVIDANVGSIHFQFSFQGNRMTLFMRKQEESILTEFMGHLVGFA